MICQSASTDLKVLRTSLPDESGRWDCLLVSGLKTKAASDKIKMIYEMI